MGKGFDIAVILIFFIIILVGSIDQIYSGITMLQGEEKHLTPLVYSADKLNYREYQNILTNQDIAWLKICLSILPIIASALLFRKQLKVIREKSGYNR